LQEVAIGPFTPGFVADQSLATELAELGIILLMFGVGLHFSLHDLLSVRAIALPGALAQIAVATLTGFGLAMFLGWSAAAGVVFGLACARVLLSGCSSLGRAAARHLRQRKEQFGRHAKKRAEAPRSLRRLLMRSCHCMASDPS